MVKQRKKKHDKSTIKLDASQQAAVDAACTRRFTIITGGAGTGKTTIIKTIANELKGRGEAVNLCAFAGKAAARLREATGHAASTIHRMLLYQGDRFALQHLHGRTVIMDESSMVNSDLLAEIIVREPSRLVLVGDDAQLAPVGAGQPFHDLIVLQSTAVRNLTTCYRATEAVYKAAAAVRGGQMPAKEDETESERWQMRHTGDARATHGAILEMVAAGELDFEQDIILSPRNDDQTNEAAAVRQLNADIVNLVNPRPTANGDQETRFLPGDRVICTKNDADKDIWNGTTGTVHSIDASGRMQVKLDYPCYPAGETEPQTYMDIDRRQARDFELAYALSVHKSQGSQYRKVVFFTLQRDAFMLLNRSLAYTAITRTQRECIVLGEMPAFATAIQNVPTRTTVMQILSEEAAAAQQPATQQQQGGAQ